MTLKTFPLRPYQREALDALKAKWQEEAGHRYAVVLPTGGGKTICFAHLCVEHLAEFKDTRVVVLVHTDELVAQAVDKISKNAPHLNVGIIKAARNDVHADVIVASVQTLRAPKRLAQVRRVGLVIVDECHHATANSYMTIMKHFGCFDGTCRVAGFTATLVRGDGKSLGTVFQGVAFERDISWMVRKRYLVKPLGKAVLVPDLDLRNVKSTKADFREGELGEALAESLAPELVAKAYAEHAAGRKAILFAPTVASAAVFADAFNEIGVKCEMVHGAMPLEDRKAVLARHRGGVTPVIANCMVLTEGYDDPEVSCIIVARPTKSKGLYIQMVGRGLRVNPDPTMPWETQDCLVLDVVGASAIHGDLRSIADLSERPLKEKDAHSGRDLIALEDEFDAGDVDFEEEVPFYTGDVEVRDFNPLGESTSSVWIKSTDGTFFMPAGKGAYVFIMQYPEAGMWSVAWCTEKPAERRYECGPDSIPRTSCSCGKRCGGRPVGMSIHRGLPLDQAMVWAEDLAADMGVDNLNTAKKSASWRRKAPSEAMVGYARALGIKVPGDTTESGLFIPTIRAGELSDLISKINGSRRIDPIVREVRRRSGG